MTDDTYPNAGRNSGYVAPVGEDIVNRLTVLISGIETKLLLSNQALTSQIDATIQQQDGRFEYLLNQLSAFLEKEDTRHDTWDAELGKMLAVMEATATTMGKLGTEFESFRAESTAGQVKNTVDIAALTLVVAGHSEQLAALHMDHEERIVALEDYRAEMQAVRDALAALSARIGDALPTEADQAVSASLRADEAARDGQR